MLRALCTQAKISAFVSPLSNLSRRKYMKHDIVDRGKPYTGGSQLSSPISPMDHLGRQWVQKIKKRKEKREERNIPEFVIFDYVS